jgi:large subunit ribosomal protein L28
MANVCEICGKKPITGRTVSHSHNVNPRIFFPNLRVKHILINGTMKKVKLCMKCLKATARI